MSASKRHVHSIHSIPQINPTIIPYISYREMLGLGIIRRCVRNTFSALSVDRPLPEHFCTVFDVSKRIRPGPRPSIFMCRPFPLRRITSHRPRQLLGDSIAMATRNTQISLPHVRTILGWEIGNRNLFCNGGVNGKQRKVAFRCG